MSAFDSWEDIENVDDSKVSTLVCAHTVGKEIIITGRCQTGM
jgi:hypothetical protein